MCQCFYCANGKTVTPPGCESFEEFVDATTVVCKIGMKTGCSYCAGFTDVDEAEHKKSDAKKQSSTQSL